MSSRRRAIACVVAVACCTSSTGCAHTFEPAAPPPRSMPEMETLPPEPESGMARVVFSTDIPSRVDRIEGTRRGSNVLLCERTPCAVTLPYGDHVVTFVGLTEGGRSGATTVHVRHPTEVVNHTLGRHDPGAGTILGGLAVVTGLILVGVGLGMAKNDREHDRPPTEATHSMILGGSASVLGGFIMFGAFPGTHQEGATTQWSPEPAARPFGGSVGLRF